jgi:hypothetical protein
MLNHTPVNGSAAESGSGPVALDAVRARLSDLSARAERVRQLQQKEDEARREREQQAEAALAQVRAGMTALEGQVARLEASRPGREALRQLEYEQMRQHIRDVVNQRIPFDAVVLVVSKGDDELLDLDGRKAMHFLQNEEGVYAGYHPADSTEATAHLEAQRARGAGYLIFPSTSLWWLAHYAEFRAHLDNRCRRLHADRHCMIFELTARPPLWQRVLGGLSGRTKGAQ